MLRARGVSARYGTRAALDGVDFDLRPGEVVAVVGPNGAGKSTLLRVLAGELAPHGGEVTLDSRPLRAWERSALARRRAVLSQNVHLTFPFRVAEVVLLGRSPHAGLTSRQRDGEIAAAALAEAGAGSLAHRVYTTLSGGERQRVQLARVLAQIWPEPGAAQPYLLLDEPVANLDPAQQHATLAVARKWAGHGAGVLAILHDLNLAAMYADRVCVLNGGTLAGDGPPGNVFTAGLVSAVFGLDVVIERHPHRECPVLLPA